MAKRILVVDDDEMVLLALNELLTPEGYEVHTVLSGKEALGEATVRIIEDGRKHIGRGISTDIIEASAKAYVDAINRMVSAQQQGEDDGVKVEL